MYWSRYRLLIFYSILIWRRNAVQKSRPIILRLYENSYVMKFYYVIFIATALRLEGTNPFNSK